MVGNRNARHVRLMLMPIQTFSIIVIVVVVVAIVVALDISVAYDR